MSNANQNLQASTAPTTRSAVPSGSRRHTASRFPHLRSLHHKRFFPLNVLILPTSSRARCVNYPPLSCCVSSMPDTSVRISFLLLSSVESDIWYKVDCRSGVDPRVRCSVGVHRKPRLLRLLKSWTSQSSRQFVYP